MAKDDFFDFEEEWENNENSTLDRNQEGEMNISFVLDTSGSMRGNRIEQLNFGMSTALSTLKDVANQKNVGVNVRVIEFNSNADYIMGKAEDGVKIDDAIENWRDLNEKVASTRTDLALLKAQESMHNQNLGYKNFPPVVILITDGKSDYPNETEAQAKALKASLKSKKNPDKDMVLVISIGVEDADEEELKKVATVGNIIDRSGNEVTTRENVPFAFNISNVNDLKNVLQSLTIGSLFSSTNQKNDNHFTFDAF